MKRILVSGILLAITSHPLSAQSSERQNDKLTASSAGEENKDPASEYNRLDVTTMAKVVRDKATKNALLIINISESWKLYAGTSPENINEDTPILTGIGKGQFPLNIDNNTRSYFRLVTENGSGIISENHLPMAGGYNFRDLGGIRTKDGHHIKWNKLIRSDELGHLTDSDLSYLASLPLKTVVDFRRPDEIRQLPDRLPLTVKNDISLNIVSANLKPGSNSKEDVRKWMVFINEELVTDKKIQHTYKEFFKLVQDQTQLPLLFHCSAGKDRTGMGAALILYALGVDEETIFQQHMLSNQYLKEKYAPIIKAHPELQPQFEVQEAYFRKAFDRIKKDHGTVENYLTTVLGVNIAEMKQIYLY
ncbi:tyrosine-protein phosphatase [Enterobacteriaceae bacterium ESL0689]|nr:tyrosine-protein phosphatase [Enterobacteriaceae bacterium ESL0689]